MFAFWICFYRLDTSYCPIYPQIRMSSNLILFRSNTGLIFRLTVTVNAQTWWKLGSFCRKGILQQLFLLQAGYDLL